MSHQVSSQPVVPRANDVYIGSRLLYAYGFEEAFQLSTTFGRVIRSGLACAVFATLVQLVSGLVIVIVVPPSSYGQVSNGHVAALVIIWFVGFLLWSLRRVQDGISGWQVVIDGRAGEAAAAQERLKDELDRRLARTPARNRRVRQRGRDVIRVKLETYACYVSVFPFGTDLFVGWIMTDEPTFWDRVARWLSTLFQVPRWFARELRSYEAKALRDVVHHATREAVAMAGRTIEYREPGHGAIAVDPANVTQPQPQIQFRRQ